MQVILEDSDLYRTGFVLSRVLLPSTSVGMYNHLDR